MPFVYTRFELESMAEYLVMSTSQGTYDLLRLNRTTVGRYKIYIYEMCRAEGVTVNVCAFSIFRDLLLHL